MATNYPTSLDVYTTLTDNTDDVLAAHANDRGDAIEAIEAKVGINSSAVNTSIDYFLKHASGAYRIHVHDEGSDDGLKIPIANLNPSLRIYDSGWFAVSVDTSYAKTHNLGTTKCLVTVLLAQNNDGSGWCFNMAAGYGNNVAGTYVAALTTTAITLRTATNQVITANDINGNTIQPTSGYARIIMLALE